MRACVVAGVLFGVAEPERARQVDHFDAPEKRGLDQLDARALRQAHQHDVHAMTARAGGRFSNRRADRPSRCGSARLRSSPVWSFAPTRTSSTSGWTKRCRISSAPAKPEPPRTAARKRFIWESYHFGSEGAGARPAGPELHRPLLVVIGIYRVRTCVILLRRV